MRVYIGPTSDEHRRAMDVIRRVFESQRHEMNGRDFRRVVKAYMAERGLGNVPFRTRTETEYNHGLQAHYLTLSLPDLAEYSPAHLVDVRYPDGFSDDVTALASTWFDRNEHLFAVAETTRMGGWSSTNRAGYASYRVEFDPWFFDKD